MRDLRAGCLVVLIAAVLSQTSFASLGDAERMLEAGNLDGALAEVEAILEHTPDDPETRFFHGIVLAEKGQDDDAIVVFAALTQDYPELPEPYNNLAVLFAQKGDYEKARDALRAAIRTHPSYSTAHENLGDLYAKMASNAYDRALEENSGNESARLKLSQINDLFSRPEAEVQIPVQVAELPKSDPEPMAEVVEQQPEPLVDTPPEPVEDTPVADTIEDTTVDVVNRDTAVMAAVTAWSEAWAAQDVDGYLSYYAPNFRPRGNLARATWEVQRRDRLRRPNFIEVIVENPTVNFNGEDSVRVEFKQTYRADSYSDQVKKLLDLQRVDGSWKISREQSAAL
ncbi:MAG: tetratricopeptide repeat protein [Pseudomonadota bacterium]